MNGEILNAMARLGGQYAARGIYHPGAYGFYNESDHRQCAAVDEQGLDCAGPEGHEPPHANVNGEWDDEEG